MRKITIITLMALFSASLLSQEVVSRLYFKNFMGHVHKSPSVDSSSLTAVQCGFKVKVLKPSSAVLAGWSYVKVGDDLGFIEDKRLSSQRPNCFQGRYQDYYNALNLDLTELYYLGRLDEQMKSMESKAK